MFFQKNKNKTRQGRKMGGFLGIQWQVSPKSFTMYVIFFMDSLMLGVNLLS